MLTTDHARFWSMDTPAGPVMVAQCVHPESDGERPDIPLGLHCPEHMRTVYYCDDTGTLWCDGLIARGVPPVFEAKPHLMELTMGAEIA